MKNHAVRGFTLLETAIVLLIVGLIVGGIFLATEMIKGAEIRATAAQYEKYNAAVNAFEAKYNALPGDILSGPDGNAAKFGLYTYPNALPGFGDEDGRIDGRAMNAGAPRGETIIFWRHLSEAQLIDGTFAMRGNSVIDTSVMGGSVTGVVTNVSDSFPPAKIGQGNYFVVVAVTDDNWFQIFPIKTVITNDFTSDNKGLSPMESENLDRKIDDGAPMTGMVKARNVYTPLNGAPLTAFVAGPTICVVGNAVTGIYKYNTSPTAGGNERTCSPVLRFN